MGSESIIVQFFGSLVLALLTGSWQPIGAPEVSQMDLPGPVVFAATWPERNWVGDRTNTFLLLADGTARAGAVSSIVSPARSDATP